MSRETRVEFPGAIYHAMGRAMGGVKAFAKDEHRERFLESLGQKVESGDLIVQACDPRKWRGASWSRAAL